MTTPDKLRGNLSGLVFCPPLKPGRETPDQEYDFQCLNLSEQASQIGIDHQRVFLAQPE